MTSAPSRAPSQRTSLTVHNPPANLTPVCQTPHERAMLAAESALQFSTLPPTVLPHEEDAFTSLGWPVKQEFSFQYLGYPALSKHMASEHDFCVLRRFAPLQVRCLLYLQHEIAVQERALEAWDDYVMKQPKGDGNNSSMAMEEYPQRTTIIRTLLPLLKEYNELVESFAKIRERPTAQGRTLENLTAWFTTYSRAITLPEQYHLNKEGDMFPIVSISKTPLAAFLERSKWIQLLFKVNRRSDHTEGPEHRYWNDTALQTFTTAIILSFGAGILLGPVWWLNQVSDNDNRLAIITGFPAVFVVWCWLAAGNRPFEILAAFAAYTAVLMIYRQLGSS